LDLEDWILFLMPLFNNLPNNWLATIDILLQTTPNATLVLIDELLGTFNMFLCRGEIIFSADNFNPTFSLAENSLFYQNKIFQESNIYCKVENVQQKEAVIVSISSILENSIYCRKHFGNKYQLQSIDISPYINNILCSSTQIDATHRLSKFYNSNSLYLRNEIREFFILIDLETVFNEIENIWNSKILECDDNWTLLNRWLKEIDSKYFYDINYFYQYSGTELWYFLSQMLNCDLDYINLISIPELIIEFAYSKAERNDISLFDKLVINKNTKININGISIFGLRTDKLAQDFTDDIDNVFITTLSLLDELDDKSLYLFYGTNSVHAENIIRNGIDSNYKLRSDFGCHYFYLTPHFKDCVHFAKYRSPVGTVPTVLIYKIKDDLLKQFGDNFHSFDDGPMINGSWEQLVKSSRNSANKSKSLLTEANKKSCIYGDQADNIKQIVSGDIPKPRIRNCNDTFKQLSVGNDDEWFDNQLVGVILFNNINKI
jgi:hypothetical protein